MADVRCPQCGQSNPPDRETCRFCLAALNTSPASPFDEDTFQNDIGRQDEPPAVEGDLPDWLQELRPPGDWEDESAGTGAEEEALPDWMRSTEAGSPTPSAQAEPDEESMPDWLARLGSDEEAPEPDLASGTPPPEQEGDFDDGERVVGEQPLAGLPDEEAGIPPWLVETSEQPGEEEEAGERLDRLEGVSEASEESFDTVFEAEDQVEGAPAADIDDTGGPLTPGESPVGSEPPLERDMPAWLRQLHEDAGRPGPAETEEDLTAAEEPPGAEAYAGAEEQGVADEFVWGGEQPAVEEQAAVENQQGASTFHIDEELPFQEETDGLPDWISQAIPEESEGEDTPAGEAETGAETGLERADLPTWLEAMRPVESAAPLTPLLGEEERVTERSGPLAGLNNVLQAEPSFDSIKKPPVYSVKLQVTENQQAHAALLEQLLASENEARQVQERPGTSSLAALRIGIALLLVVAVLLPRWIGPGWFSRPVSAVPQASEAAGLIASLPQGSPVLLAVDYEAAYAGEMDMASAGVVSQLLARGAQLAVVSTLPSGPVNAQRFLSALDEQRAIPNVSYYNLGFIPGGQAGLRSFAENPRQVFPYTIDTRRVWELQTFENIQTVAGFRLVMVITESPDLARNWIEQVQPLLQDGQVPMIMVVSTQAEPMVRPYYATSPPQVTALISGLPGGSAYEQAARMPGRASAAWDSYGAGLLLAVLLLFFGGFVAALVHLISRRQDAKNEASL